MAVKAQLKPLQEALERAITAPPEALDLVFRPMFGGIGVYARGRFFASISGVGLALKLPADQQEALLSQEPDARRLQYAPDAPVSKEYIVVPAYFIDNSTLLEAWVENSIDYVLTLPVKKSKKKKSRTGD
jgi:TfoX/Sxy family transcriptional regulator of competence genes